MTTSLGMSFQLGTSATMLCWTRELLLAFGITFRYYGRKVFSRHWLVQLGVGVVF